MSKIPDIEEAIMPFEEKMTWVALVVTILVSVAYFAVVMPQLATTPASEIAYQRPMIIAVIASIILNIAGAIVASIATAIGTAVSAEIAGGSGADAVKDIDIDRKDERDKDIGRRGELIGYYVSSVGMVGVLVITMMEYSYFWIANLLYLSFITAAIVSAVAKLVAYRRGF